MKYQEKVECAQDKAQEEFDNRMGDILDSTKEQLETEWFILFSTYCDIKYLLRSFTICHHVSICITIYHHLLLSVTNCQYLSLSTKVTIKQTTRVISIVSKPIVFVFVWFG